jgi:hypothetical protein
METSIQHINDLFVDKRKLKPVAQMELFEQNTNVLQMIFGCIDNQTQFNITKASAYCTYQTDNQDVYCEHALTNWQMSSLTFSTCP